jgi:hypothetical protein
MKTATIIINGEDVGSYTKSDTQTEEDFENEVKLMESYCVREAYHRTNDVTSKIIIK